ncbi:MAG: hypothetical protein H7144_11040 [Burkholderiales bacterium]|nr:hypothetical protein [Phycisphaerae bacterium]
MDDIPANTTISGTPALVHRQALREQAAARRIPEVIVEMRKLQDEVATLKKLLADGKA